MKLNKTQLASIVGAVILFLVLYFGFGTKGPKEQLEAPDNTEQNDEQISQQAIASLDGGQKSSLEELEKELDAADGGADQIEVMKRLSGFWYASGNTAMAGIWAEKVAMEEKSDSSWSVAGATFYQGLVKSTDVAQRNFFAERSIQAFEKAAELSPDHPGHRVNQALVYAENPPEGQPMKAVLLLRELEQKYPEAASVYNALGRLAIKTGQWERAIQRLEKAYQLEPENVNTPCLLARAYEQSGMADKAAEFAAKCN